MTTNNTGLTKYTALAKCEVKKDSFWKKHGRKIVVIIATLTIAATAALGLVACYENNSATSTTSVAGTWKMEISNHPQYRLVNSGVKAIYKADTKKEAKAAVETWIGKIKTDPVVLARTCEVVLDEKSIDESTLYSKDSDGNLWATEKAVKLVDQLEVWATTARTIKPATAPSNGTNTGISGSSMTKDSGVYGTTKLRKSIKVVGANKVVIYIMARCGNLVFTSKITIKPGPTDNKLLKKSSNLQDYQRPGTDSTTDSGAGTKPKSSVTTPAEKSPTKVSSGGKTAAGSETNTTAPGASSNTSSSTPAPEKGAGTNSGDPGLPSGF